MIMKHPEKKAQDSESLQEAWVDWTGVPLLGSIYMPPVAKPDARLQKRIKGPEQ